MIKCTWCASTQNISFWKL